jgi:hypothetical protein
MAAAGCFLVMPHVLLLSMPWRWYNICYHAVTLCCAQVHVLASSLVMVLALARAARLLR